MSNINEVRKALEILKNEKLRDLAIMADSKIVLTLYDLHFANFDIIEDFINGKEPKKKKRINPEEKEFKIVYKSPYLIGRKQKDHYTNCLADWLYYNHGAWKYYPENYFPIEIYDKKRKLMTTLKDINDVYEIIRKEKAKKRCL